MLSIFYEVALIKFVAPEPILNDLYKKMKSLEWTTYMISMEIALWLNAEILYPKYLSLDLCYFSFSSLVHE